MPRSAILNVLVNAALKAGRGLARDFGEVENLQVSVKGPGDFVSIADKRAEEVIQRELEKARPSYGFLMEESGEVKGSDGQHRWIVDPLDGTTNFLHGLPYFCVSIGLERQMAGGPQIVAGVIYNPVTNELFEAERGGGAFLNDRRLRVSGRRDLAECVVGMGMPSIGRGNMARFRDETDVLLPRIAATRRNGASALDLAFVAAGRMDAYWDYGLQPWDVAAGMLLVREAGGTVSDERDRDRALQSGDVVAGNEAVHKALMKLLAEARERTSAKPVPA